MYEPAVTPPSNEDNRDRPSHCIWTWSLTAVLVVLNVGLFSSEPAWSQSLLLHLQFDGTAIRAGEFWRLLTANLVHINRNHFDLDGAS